MFTLLRSCCCWILLLLLLISSGKGEEVEEDLRPLQCSLTEKDLLEHDPNLHEMKYDVGDGEQTTLVYVEPKVTDMYSIDSPPPASTKVTPKFNGLAGKFINMSNLPVTLYWERSKGGSKHAMRNQNPWTASGTATFPNHRFLFTPPDDPETVLAHFIIQQYPENIYVYDPYLVQDNPEATEQNLKEHLTTQEDRDMYEFWRKTLSFHGQYRNFTGRSYLANYLRDPPQHFMWRADYFGQQHYVETRETHFVSEPPQELLEPILTAKGRDRILKYSDPRTLQEYRAPGRFNMTLTALSVAPRVFQIDNFLSPIEVDHITELASGIKLSLSSTGEVNKGEKRIEKDDTKTRTSYNSWVSREKSPIIDAIYRRAADLMRIDEALFRHRDADEVPDRENKASLAEALQLVNYKEGQEYTSHHDFGYARVGEKMQGARFATLLLYLNEGMTGGETTFPRWVNAETFRELKVTPVVGKAILFYSQLPDGNLDDFSQHAAKPVTDGEKWLINLWVWDPEYK